MVMGRGSRPGRREAHLFFFPAIARHSRPPGTPGVGGASGHRPPPDDPSHSRNAGSAETWRSTGSRARLVRGPDDRGAPLR